MSHVQKGCFGHGLCHNLGQLLSWLYHLQWIKKNDQYDKTIGGEGEIPCLSEVWRRLVEAIFLTVMLLYLSFEDIRKKTIPVIPMMAAGVVGVALHLYYGRLDIISVAAGIIPGVIAYIISILTDEKIGRGDAMLLIVTGIFLGFWDNLIIIYFALIFAAAGGVIAMAAFEKNRGHEMPFVPFLMMSFLLMMICNGGLPQNSV